MGFKLVFSLVFFSVCLGEFVTKYELEDVVGGAGFDRSPWRSEASNMASLHLYEGDRVVLQICLFEPVTVTIEDLILSNDGHSDTIEVSIDEKQVAVFETNQNDGGYGTLWNGFSSVGQHDRSIALSKGEHFITLNVLTADCYGTEIDMISLSADVHVKTASFWCGGTLTKSLTPSLCEQQTDNVQQDIIKPNVEDEDKEESDEAITESKTSSTEAKTKAVSTTTASSTVSLKMSEASSSTTQLSTSSTTPSPTTTTPAPTLAQVPTSKFIEQLSYKSECLDEQNIQIRFKPLSLSNMQIKARSGTELKGISSKPGREIGHQKTCDRTVWQIGTIDNNNAEFGHQQYHKLILFDLDNEETLFPGVINPLQTRVVTLHYTLPRDVSIKRGVVYLTLGLANVYTPTKIGLQSVGPDSTSDTEYVEFSKEQRVIGWDLPSKSAIAAGQHTISFFFDETVNAVQIDFIRLAYTGKETKLIRKQLVNRPVWKIDGYVYKNITDQPHPRGMDVIIDGREQKSDYAKVIITKKPVFKILTIEHGGFLYPHHEIRRVLKKSYDYDGNKFSDVSGMRFGTSGHMITKVEIDTVNKIVIVFYGDKYYVKLSVDYSYVRTKLKVLGSLLDTQTVTFSSSKISHYLAAVNGLLVDNGKSMVNVLDTELTRATGKKFNFIKISPNPMYIVPSELVFIFPKEHLP